MSVVHRSTTFRCVLFTAAIVIFDQILVSPIHALQINEKNNTKWSPITTFQKVKRLPDESSLDPVSNTDDETQRSVRKSAVLYNKADITTTTQPSNIVASLFRLNEEEGNTCILLRVDAVIEVKFKTKLGSEDVRQTDLYVPDDAEVTGDCSNEDDATLILKWKNFVFTWYFTKTLGGERWFVKALELEINTADKHFDHIKTKDKIVRLSTVSSYGTLLFMTPVGQSYSCQKEISVVLSDQNVPTMKGYVLLRAFTVQPFIFKNNEFGPAYQCSSIGAGAMRNETVPFIFGITLAAVAVLTVGGYAVFRHFKIKKVQYDTME
ncbi:lysosome-associated membrane glycoprotein 5 isoform X1 [Acyrthosiphon pisum]|uniref:Lysosome-associated membrane glycoprotein 2-like luminal domain-containing protein n=1 Tax=Acyrthosiphon pisum TaxID=7029 RepID=A0A8R2F7H7_ACYPI|nr:lysosome-associated membrane glycoprotein 5 isoform X1 [Acyrthosiphon pisum]|eukprot:XP_008182147.1 PREDICTED: lysosome-associated membrane glycoprotein 5 isoform X1 [Acyrthosiphon pisum]